MFDCPFRFEPFESLRGNPLTALLQDRHNVFKYWSESPGMDITVLGTGSPIPDPQRSGTALVVDTGTEPILVDCGPGAVESLVETSINPKNTNNVLFTHQHMDHNASFFQFAIASWLLGRRNLTVYGPEGTSRLIDAMHHVYELDFEYRESLGRSLKGLEDIEVVESLESFPITIGDCHISALPVDHSIKTYAYRFDDQSTGTSFVFSGDTTAVDGLADFASGADVLLQDCCIGPFLDDPPEDKPVWENFFDPDEQYLERLNEVHCGPAECGEIAADAGVDTLVLTHLTPYLDTDQLKREAQETFDGTVIIAEDGMDLGEWLKSPVSTSGDT